MAAFMEDHPRGRYGGVRYDLGQFGIDGDALSDSMAPYIERFGVTREA
jgi:hypothetical protein